MIHDKDYLMRVVKQFSDMISVLLLGKNELNPAEKQLVFDTQIKDIFKMSVEELSKKNINEIKLLFLSKDESQHIAYYELLGNLFYYQFKINSTKDFAEKAIYFYELWVQKSRTYSFPIIGRINELKNYME